MNNEEYKEYKKYFKKNKKYNFIDDYQFYKILLIIFITGYFFGYHILPKIIG